MRDQFVVPQFLDVESKIIGPITVRQFLILIVTAMVVALTWKLADKVLFGILLIVEAGVGAVFAFYKINGRPFHFFLINYIQTVQRPKIRIWGKEYNNKELNILKAAPSPPLPPPSILKRPPTQSRLAQLSLVVNTGGAYKPEIDAVEAPMDNKET